MPPAPVVAGEPVPGWKESPGYCEHEDWAYSEDEPSSWNILDAELEHAWATENYAAGLGGKHLANLLQTLIDQFASGPEPGGRVVKPLWAGMLSGLVRVFGYWQQVSDVLFSNDVSHFQAGLRGDPPSVPFAIIVMKIVQMWGAVFSQPEERTRRAQCVVFRSDVDSILDQSVCALWRSDPFVQRWQGNALMYYPMRILADRASASLFAWLDAGTTPLQMLRADWLARPGDDDLRTSV